MRSPGFSLLEMMFATVILLVGLVAIAQLVPASILMNHHNQIDSSAMVFAQRELDQFVDQPIGSASFTDSMSNLCLLGDPSFPNTLQGNQLAPGQLLIDFSLAPMPGYQFLFPDPSTAAPTDTIYDARWAVILTGDGTKVASKRFIISIRQYGGNGYFPPVTLDTLISK